MGDTDTDKQHAAKTERKQTAKRVKVKRWKAIYQTLVV